MIERRKSKDISQWYNNFYKKVIVFAKMQRELSSWNKEIADVIQYLLNEYFSNDEKESVRICDVGCGKGDLLMFLASKGIVDPNNLYGVDISEVAISNIKGIPKNNLRVINIEKEGLSIFSSQYFNIVVMAEVIEHLTKLDYVIEQVYRILVDNRGFLIVSFPNYLNVPWLILRILAEK